MTSEAFDFDLFVIGAGSGGVRAARVAASLGARVAIAEDRYMGGTCVNVGCVPKKLYVYASEFSKGFTDSAGFGWQGAAPTFDWPTLRDRKKAEISRLNAIYERLLEAPGATIISGRAQLSDPHTVTIEGQTFRAEKILIATGTWPYLPDLPGKQHMLTSNEIFDLEHFPKRLLIVGGGYIAVEFAGILNGLGVDTHLVYRGANLLKSFDREMSEKITAGMQEKGVKIHLNTQITSLEKEAGVFNVNMDHGETIASGLVLYATGRIANTSVLGLENTKIELRRDGSIPVNEQFCTAEPSIYALGDVIDRVQLTPVAIQEAMVLVDHLYGRGEAKIDYDNIPTAVFCQPEFSTVGLSEEAANKTYADISVYTSDFKPMLQTLGGGNDRISMKLIVDKASDKVVGCHMVGEHAAEIIQGIGIAIKAGATKADFDATVGIHPSAAEEFVTMREPSR